ncbi:lipopolysaccharide biosynthesis protein [Streptomyces sp. NPDC046759]|uniref:lipopolysaccharide biosynthesis protein n=1 Tax=Streptomyces sp. NPDC046759 TaxID=3155019 RepID=UPI0033D663E0
MSDSPPSPVRPPRRAPARASRLALWCAVPAGVLLGAAAGVAYAVVTPAQYTATSYVIAVPADRTQSDSAATIGFAQGYGRALVQLAELGQAQVRAGVPVRKLHDSVRAATSPDAPMIAITATSGRPGQAADLANAVSDALTEQADRTKRATGIALVHLSRALRPDEPSSEPPALTALVGAAAGGLLGGLVLLARPRGAVADGAARRAQLPGPAPAADSQEVR